MLRLPPRVPSCYERLNLSTFPSLFIRAKKMYTMVWSFIINFAIPVMSEEFSCQQEEGLIISYSLHEKSC